MAAELADKVWDLGNYVVGFAAAQGLSYSFGLGTSAEFRRRVRSARRLVLSLTVAATVVYVAAAVVCACLEASLRGSGEPTVTTAVWVAAALRCGGIVAVNALAALATWVNRQS